jgi:hypothetical protein
LRIIRKDNASLQRYIFIYTTVRQNAKKIEINNKIMNETITLSANICGILGFFTRIFAVSKVFKLKQQIKGDNNSNVNVKGNVGGRDKN